MTTPFIQIVAPQTPPFIQIVAHGSGTFSGSYVYGLTAEGEVYEWTYVTAEDRIRWVRLENKP